MHRVIRPRRVLLRLLGLALWACLSACGGGSGGGTAPGPLTLALDFNTAADATGWVLGSADYSDQTAPSNLWSEVAPLPAPLVGLGLGAGGQNHSDDLFVYLKRRFGGFHPGQTYTAQVQLTIAAAIPHGCLGVGGAPGEGVTVKAGVSGVEPLTLHQGGQYMMNVDKGNQAEGGTVGVRLGDLTNSGTDCQWTPAEAKTMQSPQAITATADAQGALWVFFGIDSGYESGSGFTLMAAQLTFLPQ